MEKITNTNKFQSKQKPSKTSWWIPVWKGFVVDSTGKHHQRMGASIWLYLYLLFSVNRKNGTVSKKQKDMAQDIGLTVRTIQRHLLRLRKNDYITLEKHSKPPKISITKWKLFNHKQFND